MAYGRRRRFPTSFWFKRRIRRLSRDLRKFKNFTRFYKNKVYSGGGSSAGFAILNNAARGSQHKEISSHLMESSGPDMAQPGLMDDFSSEASGPAGFFFPQTPQKRLKPEAD